MKINIIWKGEKYDVNISENATTSELIKNICKITNLNRDRINVTYQKDDQKVHLKDKEKISEIKEKVFTVRDFGPQFSYKGVFILEYFGPFFIWPICKIILNSGRTYYLTLASLMWTFHFTKRLFETILIHTFSHKTMPLFNLFKNCIYYWGFSILISVSVIKHSKATNSDIDKMQYIFSVLFFIFELTNAYTHIRLRTLRTNGSLAHVLPKGFLFENIVCPNFTFEILSWFCFALFTRTWPAYLFSLLGATQMWIWASKKKNNLIKDYPEVRKRGCILPHPNL